MSGEFTFYRYTVRLFSKVTMSTPYVPETGISKDGKQLSRALCESVEEFTRPHNNVQISTKLSAAVKVISAWGG